MAENTFERNDFARVVLLGSRCFGRRDFAHVALDVFHDHNGVIDHDPDGKDHPEQGNRIDRESQGVQPDERADQRDRHSDRGDNRGPPALEKHIHDEHDEDHGLRQRLHHFFDRDFDKPRGVVGNIVGHTGRKILGQFVHLCARAAHRIERIGPRREKGQDEGSGLAVPSPL